jgi:hypothetical protein
MKEENYNPFSKISKTPKQNRNAELYNTAAVESVR